jgi:mannose-6-phosphate isomerase-like protein (cupin superfamily)
VFIFHHPVMEENPPHAHLGFTKVLYVLTGHYRFRVGERDFAGDPGTLVVVPRGSQHAFTTSTGGRILFVCAPSGNEEMFIALSALEPDATSEARDAVYARFETRGIEGPDGAPWRPS